MNQRSRRISPLQALKTVPLMTALMALPAAHADPAQSSYKDEGAAAVEEIFVFRTARTQHTSGQTSECAAAPFSSANEDFYELWSIQVRAADSRVVNTHQRKVGGFTACLGQLTRGQPLQMYAVGSLAQIPWNGVGECLALMSQPPIRTGIAFTCHLNLGGLPERYTGGILTSSTLAPVLGKDQPPTAHIPGYLSTSVVTVRLWKKPVATE
jgi:hypothetical protein